MAHRNDDENRGHRSISQLHSAQDFQRHFDSVRRSRQSVENQWKVNLAFYKGRQYTYYNKSASRIESLPVEDGEKPRYRVRVVSNQIMPGAQSLLAKMTKTKPILAATPSSAAYHDIRAAQMSESLLEHWWDDLDLSDKQQEALLWGMIASSGWWKITWDPHAGKPMRFMVNPETGEPIVHDELKTLFMQELEAEGVPLQSVETVAYMGDIRVEAMSPFHVFPDPAAKVFRDAKYVYCDHYLDPEEVKVRFGKDIVPDSSPADADAPIPLGSDNQIEQTLVKVTVGYFKPSAVVPDGRYVAWNEKEPEPLADEKWPFPTHDLPLVQFPGIRIPGSITNSSVVEHAIPLQKELNRTLSQIVEYKNLTIKPRVWAPVGSLRERLTNEPGAVYQYTPVGGMKPEVETLPTMPPYVFNHLNDISSRLRDIFSLTEVTEGTVPPNVEAGIAIDLLQEMATDRLAPTIQLHEKALERAGNLMLALAREYYEEPRLIMLKGMGGSPSAKEFTKSDIAGGVAVKVEAGSALPRTRAGRQARIEKFVEMGIIPPDRAWKYFDMADLKSLQMEFQSDEDQAQRDLQKILRSEPLNEESLKDAMEVVQQGMNPETQQPFQSEEEVGEFIRKSAFMLRGFENAQAHESIFRRFMSSVEFEVLPENIRRDIKIRYDFIKEKIAQDQPAPEIVPPRVTYQIKGTAGPTASSEILNKAGVEVDPETMTEVPLETWVSDSIDKPDVDSAGNDPVSEEDQQMLQAVTLSKAIQEQADNSVVSGLKIAQEEAKTNLAEAKAEAARKQATSMRKTTDAR